MTVLIRSSARKRVGFRDYLREEYEEGEMQAPFAVLVCWADLNSQRGPYFGVNLAT